MKTSNRISMWFTIFVGVLMMFFIVLLNIGFFASWHNDRGNGMMRGQGKVARQLLSQELDEQSGILSNDITIPALQSTEGELPNHFPMLQVQRSFRLSTEDFTRIEEAQRLWYSADVYQIDENRFLAKPVLDGYVLTDVTQNISRQNELLFVSGFLWVCFLVLTYLLSRIFVSRSLRDLYALSDSVRDTNIDTLGKKHVFSHLPVDDEINIVASSIDQMQDTISTQVDSMRDFVSHVSHEFKTPLMVLQSTTDLAQKTGNIASVIPQYKKTIDQMKNILDALTVVARSQSGSAIHSEKVNINELVDQIVGAMSEKYSIKKISCIVHKNDTAILQSHTGSAEIVLTNIVENAYKYTAENGKIEITITPDGIIIQDNGEGISQQAQKHIREPFWQADKNREDGVGLGLHIVKRLVEILGWSIKLESTEGEGTTVSLEWE